jgi:hypothetical protein
MYVVLTGGGEAQSLQRPGYRQENGRSLVGYQARKMGFSLVLCLQIGTEAHIDFF